MDRFEVRAPSSVDVHGPWNSRHDKSNLPSMAEKNKITNPGTKHLFCQNTANSQVLPAEVGLSAQRLPACSHELVVAVPKTPSFYPAYFTAMATKC